MVEDSLKLTSKRTVYPKLLESICPLEFYHGRMLVPETAIESSGPAIFFHNNPSARIQNSLEHSVKATVVTLQIETRG